MPTFKSFPIDHRKNGRFAEALANGSRVFLEVWHRNRHPRGNELVKLDMNMRMGRAPSYYVEETQISLFFEHRQRVDIEVLPQGYRYGRYFDRSLRTLCETLSDALVPQPQPTSGREDLRQASLGREPDDGVDEDTGQEDDVSPPAMR
jgi:hypothetical protein